MAAPSKKYAEATLALKDIHAAHYTALYALFRTDAAQPEAS
jgi:hypothetical protein